VVIGICPVMQRRESGWRKSTNYKMKRADPRICPHYMIKKKEVVS